MRDTLLLVGNGLAMDYRSHSPQMPDPGHPLDYTLCTPGSEGHTLRETFRELWRVIDAIKASEPGIGDFPLIERLRRLPRIGLDRGSIHIIYSPEQRRKQHERELVEYQLRLYLTHAYSHFTRMIHKPDLESWRWFSWLRANHDRLYLALSFNYDLLVEQALLENIPVSYLIYGGRVFGINREILVFKPHGSVNFEFADNIFSGLSRSTLYEAKNVFKLTDAPLRVLSDSELNRQRLGADIVLPTKSSLIRRFQYIEPGYRYLRCTRNDVSRCIIIGLYAYPVSTGAIGFRCLTRGS